MTMIKAMTDPTVLNQLAVTKLDFPKQDLKQITIEMDSFLKKYPFQPTQVCLNDTGQSNQFDPYEGLGSLYNYDTKIFRKNEEDFQRWCPDIQDGAIFQLVQQLEKQGYRIGRTRFMNLKARSCYSFHFDPSKRIHLALQTTTQASLVFPPNQVLHIPANGQLYLVDTTRLHSAMNGDMTDRIHLVMALA